MLRRKSLSHPYLLLVLVPSRHLGHNPDFLCYYQGTQVKSLSFSGAGFFPYVSLVTWLEMLLSAEPLVTLLSVADFDCTLLK